MEQPTPLTILVEAHFLLATHTDWSEPKREAIQQQINYSKPDDGPLANNDAEIALRPLVGFRKVCRGLRGWTGSENLTIFSNFAGTTRLQKAVSHSTDQVSIRNSEDIRRVQSLFFSGILLQLSRVQSLQ